LLLHPAKPRYNPDMTTVAELERAIEELPEKDFKSLAAWVEQRSRAIRGGDSSREKSPATAPIRDHTSFLNGYTPEDEDLYDDARR
jgi:hypothetical protein